MTEQFAYDLYGIRKKFEREKPQGVLSENHAHHMSYYYLLGHPVSLSMHR